MYRDGFKVDILFLLEHRDRELDATCAIAKVLKSTYGVSVAIASLSFHAFVAAIFVRPKIIVVPFCFRISSFPISLFWLIYGDTVTYVNMNLEQILSPANKEYKRPSDEFARRILKHFCWGRAFQIFLLDNGVDERHIYITGNPATCLLREMASRDKQTLQHSLTEHFQLSRARRWIFFPMNCGWAFASTYKIKTRIAYGYDAQKAWAYRSYLNTTLDTIFQWIVRAREVIKANNTLIILRPHPSVSVQQYQERFMKLRLSVPSCVYISKDLTFKEWLVCSDLCYTNFSTVALDAQWIGKSTYLLEPKPYPEFLKMPWYDALPRITSFDEFLFSLEGQTSTSPEKRAMLDKYMDLTLDGIKETAKYLAEFINHQKRGIFSYVGFVKGIVTLPRETIGGFLRMIGMKRDFLGFNPFRVFVRSGIAPDFFEKGDIEKLLERDERNS